MDQAAAALPSSGAVCTPSATTYLSLEGTTTRQGVNG
jgi:hypothetical protein